MEKRTSRVSEAQWSMLMEFLEAHPSLARARGYNNSARGRQESLRLWKELASFLNAERSGTTKSAKDWSIYVSNYKSKLKKAVADLNADANGTGVGTPRGSSFTELESRFLAIMGSGLGQTGPPNEVQQQPPTSGSEPITELMHESCVSIETENVPLPNTDGRSSPISGQSIVEAAPDRPASPEVPLPRRTRRTRYRNRPLAPHDEARRIMAEIEIQRASSDAANERALKLIGQSLSRIANSLELYLARTKM